MAECAWKVEIVCWPSPLFEVANDLRFHVLHEPFGVTRDDQWNDEDPLSHHVVALADGDLIGYARLIEQDGGLGQVRQVCVAPAWERRRVGTALIQRALELAADLGLAPVWLNARVTAIPFYERLGFVVVSEVFATPRTYLPHVRMELAPSVG